MSRCGPISHATAVDMLSPRPDLGSEAFMAARMGVGMFVFDAARPGEQPSRWMLHQAANDGFRGVFLVCFDGPDAADGPRGFVVLCNGDNKGMTLLCDVARQLLEESGGYRVRRAELGRVEYAPSVRKSEACDRLAAARRPLHAAAEWPRLVRDPIRLRRILNRVPDRI